MRNPVIDLTGQRFGRLVVIERGPRTHSKQATRWRAICDCGNEMETNRTMLVSGRTKSCGCYKRDFAATVNLRHGMSGSPIYQVWTRMWQRCTNERRDGFEHYGGRGITVCDRWRSFERFFEDMGTAYVPGLEIDRIDVNGDYTPDNCRWVDDLLQASNKRTSRLMTISGETACLTHMARAYGVNVPGVFYRVNHGWSDEEAIFGKASGRK